MIAFDTQNLYADAIGDHGITGTDLSRLAPTLRAAHDQTIERMRGGLDAPYACLNLHQTMPDACPAIEAEAATLRAFTDVIVIGIGGSNLGAMAVQQALAYGGRSRGGPRLHYVDNIDPDYLHDLLARLTPNQTGVIVISKSGGTLETATQYLVIRDWLTQRLGAATARRHQWIVTDPETGWLRALARQDDLPTLPVPPMVGGRYSVLTAVGLLPLAVAGVDIRALLDGARANAKRCESGDVAENPALELAATFYALDTQKTKRLSILMPYVHALRLFGDWYRQLWAESLGKHDAHGTPAGTLPVTALGAVDQHSQLQMYLESRHDKVFSFIALEAWRERVAIPLSPADEKGFPYLRGKTLSDVLDAEFRATRQVITDYGHPNCTLVLPQLDAHAVGELIDLYQRTTVYAGLLYGINPLDQPAVEAGKQLAVKNLQGR